MAMQLQNEEFHQKISKNVIEKARLSLFKLISLIFQEKGMINLFFDDILFLTFFLSLLYEENIRPFILSKIKMYLSNDNISEHFLFSICQVIEQVRPSLPQTKFILLMIDLVSTIKSSNNSKLLCTQICDLLKNQFSEYDNSKESNKLLMEIIPLFTEVEDISPTCISALETPLTKFKHDINDFNLLVNLLSGSNNSNYSYENPNFIIKNGQTLNILFKLFIDDEQIDVIHFSYQLCLYNQKNCYICHMNGFDILVLDYVFQNRQNNTMKISKILSLVVLISSYISSPVVVQRFISLFIPVESRYISEIHYQLLQPLHTIFTNSFDVPCFSIPLNFEQVCKITLPKIGFSYVFWLCFENETKTKLFSLNTQDKTLFSLYLENDKLLVNDISTGIILLKNRWTHICINYDTQQQNYSIFIDGHNTISVNLQLEFNNNQMFTQIGGNEKTDCRISNFGLYSKLTKQQINSIFTIGPRSIRTMYSPIFYYNAKNMKTISEHELTIKVHNFADILLLFFKIEILLPLFAQIDLPLKSGNKSNFGIMGVISILEVAFLSGELEQYEFAKSKGFSIIAHLLCSSSPKQISTHVYLAFYRIFQILISENAKKELFLQILMNVEIWFVIPNEDQLQILNHWKNFVFPNNSSMFFELMPINSLLNVLRIYYWYEIINTNEIRGEIPSTRQRNHQLNVKECRKVLLELILNMSMIRFTINDFNFIINNFITIKDQKQRIDLLNLLSKIICNNNFQLTDFYKILSKIYENIEIESDKIIIKIFKVIINIHKKSKDFTLSQHLDILLEKIKNRKFTEKLYKSIIQMVKNDSPEMFQIGSYISYKLNSLGLYNELNPDKNFASEENWEYYSICEAINQQEAESYKIYTFLSQCSYDCWRKLFTSIEYCCLTLNTQSDIHKSRLLRVILLLLISEKNNIKEEEVITVISMVKFYLFYQNSKERKSPIFHKNNNFDGYVFGCRFTNDFKWEDIYFVKYILQIALNYRIYETIQLSLIVSGFSLKDLHDEIIIWLTQMDFTKLEIEQFSNEFTFLNYKFILLGQSLHTYLPKYESNIITYTQVQSFQFALDQQLISDTISYKTSKQKHKEFIEKIEKDIIQKQIEIPITTTISDFMDQLHVKNEENSKLWQRLWRNVNSDGAPWAPSQKLGIHLDIKWKRDFSLCAFNCPFKLKQNHKFDDHMKASFSRDAGSSTTATELLLQYQKQLQDEYSKSAPPEILSISSLQEKSSLHLEKNEGKQLSTYDCVLVGVKDTYPGTFVIYHNSLHIILNPSKKTFVISIPMISFIYLRRFCQLKTAIEIFLISGITYFINFPHYLSTDIIQRIQSLTTIDNSHVQQTDNVTFFNSLSYTDKWVKGEISTFEYLMKINIISGRSFNDPSQYPFLPWIISNYSTDKIDLNDPNIYRDLSKPIGAINEKRIKDLRKKKNDLAIYFQNGYLYSSFAICPLTVYLWLIRMEPFASLHIKMQSGKFDHSSRIFTSIEDSFYLVTHHFNDYRELTPEFFFQPEFLINYNHFDLGSVGTKKIDDVILPKWANNAIDFVYIMRKALESDYVSNNINNWIDLFWGYKQEGEEALKADNLYNPDLYESAWTNVTLKDPIRRAEIEASMCHVGQIPLKLFNEPHPHRQVLNLDVIQHQLSSIQITNNKIKMAIFDKSKKNNDGIKLAILNDESLILYKIIIQNTEFKVVETSNNISKNNLIIPGFYNYSIIGLLDTGKIVINELGITSIIYPDLSNISLLESNNKFIAAVSDDATLNIISNFNKFNIPFYGDAISCCSISKTFGVVVCGTVSGKIVVCSLFEGIKTNVIHIENQMKPEKILVTPSWGFILTYASQNISGHITYKLFLYTINGELIRSIETSAIKCWCCWSSRKAFDYVIFANEKGNLLAFEVFYLNIKKPFHRCYKEIVSLYYSRENNLVIAVANDGEICFIPFSIKAK